MPALSTTPSSVSVQTYPTADRGPLTWIWIGSPDLADEALIPDTSWLSDPPGAPSRGSFPSTRTTAVHENLIDQTHFPFLHPEAVGTPEYARSKLSASIENNQVIIRRELRESPPPGVCGKPAGIMNKNVDRTSEARFVSPAIHVAFAEIIDPAPDTGQPERYRYNISHCFTPETNTSIHYWCSTPATTNPETPTSTPSSPRPPLRPIRRTSRHSNGSWTSSATTPTRRSTSASHRTSQGAWLGASCTASR